MKHMLTTGTPPRSRLVVVLRENDGGEVEEFVRLTHEDAPPQPVRDAHERDAPLFTLRQHHIMSRVASAYGQTAWEMFGDCPPPSPVFLDRLGDMYAAVVRGDELQVERCLRALEAAADPELRCVSG